MNGYELSRKWFDFAFDNPDKISPAHGILYFFIVEHCNRMGWKEKFGQPTTMAMEAIGIKSYNTYKKTIEELVDWGFVKMIERSKSWPIEVGLFIPLFTYFDSFWRYRSIPPCFFGPSARLRPTLHAGVFALC